jgi:hypothetical protein
MGASVVWTGLQQAVQPVRALLDGVLSALVGPLFVGNFWWLVVSVPLWAVLGLATFAASRSARGYVKRANAAGVALPESPWGRRAKILAFAVVVYMGVGPALCALAPWAGAWGFVPAALAFDVLNAALLYSFLALIGHVIGGRQVVWMDVAAAYGAATAGLLTAAFAGYWLAMYASYFVVYGMG